MFDTGGFDFCSVQRSKCFVLGIKQEDITCSRFSSSLFSKKYINEAFASFMYFLDTQKVHFFEHIPPSQPVWNMAQGIKLSFHGQQL